MNCLKFKKIGFVAVLAAGLPVSAGAMQWPDTGQRICYDNEKVIPCPADQNSPFYGQDAQYNGPAHSYTKLGQNGAELDDDATEWIMVKDNVTGLIWELKDNMDGTADYTNLHDVDNVYFWCKRSIGAGYCNDANNTEDFINAINTEAFGGYTDWRLPTAKELLTLIDYTRLISPFVNIEYFKLKIGGGHWTADRYYGSNDYSWYVDLINANSISTYRMIDALHIRAVRGGN
ncbi:MAG: Lcl C-terminal domain-containing protein [Candidatus Electronema sp. VV]